MDKKLGEESHSSPNFFKQQIGYSSTSAKRSLTVISLCTNEERIPFDNPIGVTKVMTTPLFTPVCSIKRLLRSSNLCSYALVMV